MTSGPGVRRATPRQWYLEPPTGDLHSSLDRADSGLAPLGQRSAHLRGFGVFDGLVNPQRRLRPSDGLRPVVQLLQRQRGIRQAISFPAPVANIADNGQLLLVELNGLARVAQSEMGTAKIAEDVALPAPVANLAENDQRLFVALNGLARVA